jgi:hypothetical protein
VELLFGAAKGDSSLGFTSSGYTIVKIENIGYREIFRIGYEKSIIYTSLVS